MLYRINQKNKVDTLSVERIKTRKVKTENEKQNKSKRQARYEKCEKKERKHQMEINSSSVKTFFNSSIFSSATTP